MSKSDRYTLISVSSTCVVSALLVLDLVRVRRPGIGPESWHSTDLRGLRWPPLVGQQYVVIPELFAKTFVWMFLCSAVGLVIAALWFTTTRLMGRSTARVR
jgi:hypothetical protein